jgi:hypothetical protein
MKYLSEYTDKAISKALDDNGAFFAFGTPQFNEKKKEGVKYCSLGAGLICPTQNAKALMQAIDKAGEEGRKADLEENGKEAIILRELYNYESFYSYDWTTATQVLKSYGVTPEEVKEAFYKELPNCEF